MYCFEACDCDDRSYCTQHVRSVLTAKRTDCEIYYCTNRRSRDRLQLIWTTYTSSDIGNVGRGKKINMKLAVFQI